MNLANRWMIIRNSHCRRGLGSLRGALNVFGTEHAYGESGVLYWLSCYNARINERTGMALFSRHFLEQYQKRTAAMPRLAGIGQARRSTLPSKPREIPSGNGRTLMLRFRKTRSTGEGLRVHPMRRKRGRIAGQLWRGALDVNGDSVSLDSLRLREPMY